MKLLTITDTQMDYARQIESTLKQHGYRVELDRYI